MTSEYSWSGAEPTHATRYILPVVESELTGVSPDATLLDVGCGNGAVLGSLSPHGWDLHGLELSESGLAQARRAHPEIDFGSADLTRDLDGHKLWGKCDVVISLEVVEHVFLPRIFARNCFGFLRPGGRLILSTPYHGYLKNLALAASGVMDRHFTALWDFGHIKFWSRRTLEALLTETGFRVTAFHGAGRFPYLWKSMVIVAEKPSGE